MSKNILVIGGGGYIGSVATKKLLDNGYNVSVYDNLSKGRRDLVDSRAEFVEGDILDFESLNGVFSRKNYDSVMHFAALKDAGKSMSDLYNYGRNNIMGTLNILEAMSLNGVSKIVFSSTAAVYGNPIHDVVDENHPTKPINFYGHTKLECERLLEWYRKSKDIEYVSLRYFNVAGDGGLNYVDPDAKNIFPIIAEVLSGKRERLDIYGDDYETSDGTCIRDYIHVLDLVFAHILALDVEGSDIINLGTGQGYSVMDLLNSFEKVSGKKIPFKVVQRREGDPALLVASYEKAKNVLGWNPKMTLEDMVKSTIETK